WSVVGASAPVRFPRPLRVLGVSSRPRQPASTDYGQRTNSHRGAPPAMSMSALFLTIPLLWAQVNPASPAQAPKTSAAPVAAQPNGLTKAAGPAAAPTATN